MYVRRHGGGCCGISHVWGLEYFYPFDAKDREKARIKKLKQLCNRAYRNNRNRRIGYFGWMAGRTEAKDWKQHNIQVVITQKQEEWVASLEELGFKKVYAGKNGNSGNTCYIWMLEMKELFK